MPTLTSAADRETIVRRLAQVAPDTPARWGTLTAPRMLCHVTDQMRLGLGELPANRCDTLLRRTLLRWLVIRTGFQAPPGKVQTLPEMLTTTPTTWGADLAACVERIGRVSAGQARTRHPAFGALSAGEWAVLAWKHLDHHLRQFGV